MIGLAVAAGSAPAAPTTSRILVVTIDGARAGVEDWPEVMPALAGLAREGVRLARATTPSPATLPATVAALTGLAPGTTGLIDEGRVVHDSIPTLAQALAAAGFATAAFPADRFAHAAGPLAAGFDRFDALAPARPDSARVDSALARLAGAGRRFVWLGLAFGQPVEPWRRLRGGGFADSAAYAARAAAVDRALARLASGLPRAGPTLLVIAGTHGEAVPGWPLRDAAFDEHALPGHGADLAEDALRVPLVLHGAGIERRPPGNDPPWTSTLDLAPTLAAAAGISWRGDGVALQGLLAGGKLPARVLVHEADLGRTLGWVRRVAARQGSAKRLARGEARTNLVARPGSAPAGRPPADRLEGPLRARLAAVPPDTSRRPPNEEEACWRALLAATPAAGTLPDSTTVLRLDTLASRCPAPLVALEAAIARSQAGQDEPAARLFARLIQAQPDLEEAKTAYADHLRRHDRSELIPRALADVRPDSPFAPDARWRVAIARAHELEGAPALLAFRDALEIGAPPDPAWLGAEPAYRRLLELRAAAGRAPADSVGPAIDYARALAGFGLWNEAYEQLHRARRTAPASPAPNRAMGELLMEQQRPGPASAAFARAIEQEPDDAETRRTMAEALVLAGRGAEAIPHLRRAIELEPGDTRSRYNLACLLSLRGEVAAATAELERAVELGYADRDRIATDPDLAAVRATDAGRRLLARLGVRGE